MAKALKLMLSAQLQDALKDSACARCGTKLSGWFAKRPGTWGRRRLPVRF